MRARVGVVVLNYLHADDTIRCIQSLQQAEYRDCSLLVVDNSSSEKIVGILRNTLDSVIPVLDNGENLGYAAGNNVGIRRALTEGAEFVWLLNPDTVVEPDTLTRMIGVMRRYPQAGIVGTRILNGASRPPTIWFNGGVIDWEAEGATSHRDIGRYHDDVPSKGIEPVDYVTGASILVRRGVFDDVGLIPEDYFLYFEETDFCTRARAAGWSSLVDTGATQWHYKRSSARTPSPYYIYYFCRGRLLFRNRFLSDKTEGIPKDLSDFIDAWRTKVEDRAPNWLGIYEQLVSWAIADGTAGIGGRRDEIGEIPLPEDVSS